MDKTQTIYYLSAKQSQLKRTNSENYLSSTAYRTFHPADPLPKRKVIPLKSPRFGQKKDYLILPSFIKQEKIMKMEFKTIQREKNDPNQEKQYELDAYANSTAMMSKLVYCKIGLDKDNKIELRNILNLNKYKPEEEETDNDHTVLPFYTLTNDKDNTLIFESRFESGNLLCAFKTDDTPPINKYQLILQNDTNTTGYVQWFFFRITNTKKNKRVALNFLNLMRKVSLYNNGLKIWCYSEKKAEKENIGWHRSGENVMYYPNNYYVFNNDKKRFLYSLSFEYEFMFDDDTVYFANSLPYLYSDLMKEMNHYQIEEKKYPYFHRKTICSTLGGNDLDMITINSMPNLSMSCYDLRKSIVLLARQHPGETCSSYVLKGAIDFLLGNSDEARKLRELYLIKIFPMMNPDGVVAGNSRTSFAGCDINRRWTNPDEIMHPEVYYTKEMVLKMGNQRDISFLCDFHGHIGAYNAFFYCNHKDNPRSCSLFPYICTKLNKNISFTQSNFKMPKYKNGTGRISLFKDLELDNIVTLETSFFGANKIHDETNRVYFNSQLFREIGRDVCLGMLAYYYKYENRLIERNLRSLNVDLREYEAKIKEEDKEYDKIEEHSESEPSIDNFDRKIIMSLLPTKSRKNKKNKFGSKSSITKIPPGSLKKILKESDIKLWNINNISKPLVNPGTSMPLIVKEPKAQPKIKGISNPLVKPAPSSPCINEKEIMMGKKDEATQTEEIFFKMHWSYFAGEYPIKVGKVISHSNMNYHKVREQIMLRNKSYVSSPLVNYSNKSNLRATNSFRLRGNNSNKPLYKHGLVLSKNYFN